MIRIAANSAPAHCVLLGLAGTLLLPASAEAKCSQWDLSGDWKLAQGNGYTVILKNLQQAGATVTGKAIYDSYSDRTVTYVPIKNGIFDGKTLSFVVDWPESTINPPGVEGFYKGDIDDAGRLKGYSEDWTHPGSALTGWSSDRAAICEVVEAPPAPPPPLSAKPSSPPVSEIDKLGGIDKGPSVGDILKQTKQAPAPAQTPAPAPSSGTTATVIADVDVFESAGGGGNSLGVLRSNNKSTKVSLLAPCQDNWCHVKGDPVPGGEGWVYSGTPPDFQSLQF